MSETRRVVLVRHAKAELQARGAGDKARALAERGRAQAPALARLLVSGGWTPDYVWCSDAVRTEETLAGMADAFEKAPFVQFSRDLYLADSQTLIDHLVQSPNRACCVWLVGHNPGWEDAASEYSGARVQLKTASAACFEVSVTDWSAAGSTRPWRLVDVVRPRD